MGRLPASLSREMLMKIPLVSDIHASFEATES